MRYRVSNFNGKLFSSLDFYRNLTLYKFIRGTQFNRDNGHNAYKSLNARKCSTTPSNTPLLLWLCNGQVLLYWDVPSKCCFNTTRFKYSHPQQTFCFHLRCLLCTGPPIKSTRLVHCDTNRVISYSDRLALPCSRQPWLSSRIGPLRTWYTKTKQASRKTYRFRGGVENSPLVLVNMHCSAKTRSRFGNCVCFGNALYGIQDGGQSTGTQMYYHNFNALCVQW
jgi:hypothetical protein